MSDDHLNDIETDRPLEGEALNRRSVLKCVATWAGTGVMWGLVGGVPRAFAASATGKREAELAGADTFTFVQISDSHIGFKKPVNPDPTKTLQAAIEKANAMQPSFVLHTGDITHLSKPAEFDLAEQMLKGLNAPVHYVPGEHDALDETGGKAYLERFGKGTKGNGWYSFDDRGVHFVALVNVFDFVPGHEAKLGDEQLEWLEDDLKAVSASTPIVVFTHIPLWSLYQPWGWGTEDGARAIAYLRRFGSVTVLQGHIHQVIQKVEGNITFHTANGTAFPQPKPGAAKSPGPLVVPAEKLRSFLGLTSVSAIEGGHTLALSDKTLA